jgi:hypothetical protein
LAKTGETKLIANTTSPVLSRFLRDSHDAVIADGADRKFYYFSASDAAVWPFASMDAPFSPLDMAISSNNDRMFVVGADSSSIVSVNLSTGQLTSTPCNCAPRSLSPLYEDSLFRLTDATDSPLMLFQPNSGAGDFLFVPKPLVASNGNATPSPVGLTQLPNETDGRGSAVEEHMDADRGTSGLTNADPVDSGASRSRTVSRRSTTVAGRSPGQPQLPVSYQEHSESRVIPVQEQGIPIEPMASSVAQADAEVLAQGEVPVDVSLAPAPEQHSQLVEQPPSPEERSNPKPRVVTLKKNDAVDLVTGSKSKVNADIIWTEAEDVSRLVAKESTRFAAIATDEVAQESITADQLKEFDYKHDTLGTERLPLRAGMIFAVHTGEHYASVRINALSDGEITLRWFLYR